MIVLTVKRSGWRQPPPAEYGLHVGVLAGPFREPVEVAAETLLEQRQDQQLPQSHARPAISGVDAPLGFLVRPVVRLVGRALEEFLFHQSEDPVAQLRLLADVPNAVEDGRHIITVFPVQREFFNGLICQTEDQDILSHRKYHSTSLLSLKYSDTRIEYNRQTPACCRSQTTAQ
ncbi:MAG: hypothetical protein OXN89_25305 [Bryobacterales bacterium]|nr:hypothetical protein [Bryobacterales bacterium]